MLITTANYILLVGYSTGRPCGELGAISGLLGEGHTAQVWLARASMFSASECATRCAFEVVIHRTEASPWIQCDLRAVAGFQELSWRLARRDLVSEPAQHHRRSRGGVRGCAVGMGAGKGPAVPW